VVDVGWVLILEVVLVILVVAVVGNPMLEWVVEVKAQGLQADEVGMQIRMRRKALLERPSGSIAVTFSVEADGQGAHRCAAGGLSCQGMSG
jgi:hypothetical protein